MIKTKQIVGIFCMAGFLFLPGCQEKGEQNKSTDADEEIVCPMLYQKNDSILNALKFIEIPNDRMESSSASVRGRGNRLADQRQLVFANKLFSIRKSKDVDMFISLLSNGTKKQLNDDNNKRMLHHHIKEIENGTFCYGGYDFKFFTTFREFTEKDWDTLKKHVSFAERPTDVIHFWHFHKPNYMLIGGTYYLIEDNDSYKIVTDTLLHYEITAPPKKQRALGPKEYGIVAFKQTDDAYNQRGVWKYQWDIELGLDESENNRFEILKITTVMSGQNGVLHPDAAKEVLIEDSVFDKYTYKELKCRFYVGDREPVNNWSYGFSMASIARSSSMRFPGGKITNVKVNKQGSFAGSGLEFISFETTEEDVKYLHRVILRKKPIIPNADL